jgi:hypothetical protein
MRNKKRIQRRPRPEPEHATQFRSGQLARAKGFDGEGLKRLTPNITVVAEADGDIVGNVDHEIHQDSLSRTSIESILRYTRIPRLGEKGG